MAGNKKIVFEFELAGAKEAGVLLSKFQEGFLDAGKALGLTNDQLKKTQDQVNDLASGKKVSEVFGTGKQAIQELERAQVLLRAGAEATAGVGAEFEKTSALIEKNEAELAKLRASYVKSGEAMKDAFAGAVVNAGKTGDEAEKLIQTFGAIQKFGAGGAITAEAIGVDDLREANAILAKTLDTIPKGTQEYLNTKKVLEANTKELEKQEKAQEKANAEARNQLAIEKGLNEAIAEGALQTDKQIREAAKAIIDARKALDVSQVSGEELEAFNKKAREAAKTIALIDLAYKDVGEEAKDTQKEVQKYYTALQRGEAGAKEAFDAALKRFGELESVSKQATEQVEKQTNAYIVMGKEGSSATASVVAGQQAAKDAMDETIATEFTEAPVVDVELKVSDKSKGELTRELALLEEKFAELRPGDAGYQETVDKIKLIKKELIDVERTTEAIADIDLNQAFIDLATKGTEAFTGLANSIGQFGGSTNAAGEAVAEFEKALQLLAVVQSIQDGFRAYNETMKATTLQTVITGGATKALNFIMAASPFGLIALAVAGLVGALGGVTPILNFVTDAFKGFSNVVASFPQIVFGAFKAIPQFFEDTFYAIPKIAEAAFDLLFGFFTRQVTIFKNLFTNIFSFKNPFPDLINDVQNQITGSFDGITKVAGEATGPAKKAFNQVGSDIGGAFKAGFDASANLRINDLAKKNLDVLNAQREASKALADGLLADARLSFGEREKLTNESSALEQQSVADSIKLNKERVAILSTLGKNLSDDQKQELRDLQGEVANQSANLVNLERQRLQAQRDLQVEAQEDALADLGRAVNREVEIRENSLARAQALGTLTFEQERAQIETIAAKKASVIKAEIEAIKARGKLTLDELNRIADAESELATIQIETANRVRDAQVAAIERVASVESARIATASAGLDKVEASQQNVNLANEQGVETQNAQIEAQALFARTIEDTQKVAEATAKQQIDAINREKAATTEAVKVAKDRLDLEERALKAEQDKIKAKQATVGITQEEAEQLKTIDQQLATIAEQDKAIDLQFNLDTERFEANIKRANDVLAKATLDNQMALIDQTSGLANIAAANLNAELDKRAELLEISNLEAQQGNALATLAIDLEGRKAVSINDQRKVIQANGDLQTKILNDNLRAVTAQSAIESQRLALNRQNLETEQKRVQAKIALGTATAEEKAGLDGIQAQIDTITAQEAKVTVQLELDTEQANAELKKVAQDTKDQLQSATIAGLNQTVDGALANLASKALGTNKEVSGAIASSISTAVTAGQKLATDVLAFEQQELQKLMDQRQQEIDALNEKIGKIEEQIGERQDSLNQLFEQANTARGARQEAILAQLEKEQVMLGGLESQKRTMENERKKREAQQMKDEKEMAKMQKEQAKLEILIATSMAYAQAAAAIAGVTAASSWQGPLVIATIATVAATLLGVIGSTIGLVKSFEHGGVVPQAADGMVLSGPSHAQGGIDMRVGGRTVVNAEGGEIVLTKGVADNPSLARQASALNVAGGGVPLFEAGGIIPPATPAMANLQQPDVLGAIMEMTDAQMAIAERPQVVSVSDINRVQREVAVMDQLRTF